MQGSPPAYPFSAPIGALSERAFGGAVMQKTVFDASPSTFSHAGSSRRRGYTRGPSQNALRHFHRCESRRLDFLKVHARVS